MGEHNDYLLNPKLSLAAKGLLTIILSMPKELRTKENIMKKSNSSEAKLDSAFTELIGAGYIDNTDVKLF